MAKTKADAEVTNEGELPPAPKAAVSARGRFRVARLEQKLEGDAWKTTAVRLTPVGNAALELKEGDEVVVEVLP